MQISVSVELSKTHKINNTRSRRYKIHRLPPRSKAVLQCQLVDTNSVAVGFQKYCTHAACNLENKRVSPANELVFQRICLLYTVYLTRMKYVFKIAFVNFPDAISVHTEQQKDIHVH